jgi:hypothetical protein
MPAVSRATATGVTAAAAAAGMSVNGCVFFICTEAGAGARSGNTVTRAVSFLRLTGGGVAGDGADAAFGAVALDFASGGSGGGTDRGVCTGLFGAGGINGLAIGGRGVPAPGGFAGGGALASGRVGKVIRTVSGASGDCAACGGVTGIRTVSFFGSVGSAIRRCESAMRLPENRRLVTH